MNADKLLKLASFLDTLPPERFDYGQWATGLLTPDCGTQGCALGWATVVFPEELKLVQTSSDRCVVDLKDAPLTLRLVPHPRRRARKVFDLTEEQFDYLFEPQNDYCCEDCDGPEDEYESEENATPADVAAKIRAFVAGNA